MDPLFDGINMENICGKFLKDYNNSLVASSLSATLVMIKKTTTKFLFCCGFCLKTINNIFLLEML
jgi:hypothetical protein